MSLTAATPHAIALPSAERGQLTHAGGVFLKAEDPKAFVLWRKDMLDVPFAPWDEASTAYDQAGHTPLWLLAVP